jgi:hypothetical protein
MICMQQPLSDAAHSCLFNVQHTSAACAPYMQKQALQQTMAPVAAHHAKKPAPAVNSYHQPAYQPSYQPVIPTYQPTHSLQTFNDNFGSSAAQLHTTDQEQCDRYSRENDPTMKADKTSCVVSNDWAKNLNSTFSSITQVVSDVATQVNKAINQEEVDTGAEFVKRGHKMMEAYYDNNLQKWVFPGEDPNAPAEEELRAQRLAALPPPPTSIQPPSNPLNNGFNGRNQPLYEAVATHSAVLHRP